MQAKLRYYIIYTLDVHKDNDQSIKQCKPDIVRYPLFQVTETEDESVSEWCKAHRKYVGILTGEQLVKFLEQIGACSTCQTMGALTPEFGMLPAISFDTENCYYGYSDNAYVSPIFSGETDKAVNKAVEEFSKDQKQAMAEQEIWPIFDAAMIALENCLDDDEAAHNICQQYEFHPEQRPLFVEST